MGMPRGLIKATAYYNNLEARRDWRLACAMAKDAGIEPPEIDAESMSYKRLDKQTVKLLSQAGLTWDDLEFLKRTLA